MNKYTEEEQLIIDALLRMSQRLDAEKGGITLQARTNPNLESRTETSLLAAIKKVRKC